MWTTISWVGDGKGEGGALVVPMSTNLTTGCPLICDFMVNKFAQKGL